MKNDNNSTPAAAAPPEPKKKAYAAPQLVEYGDVRELTQSSASGSRSDGFRRRTG